jgi:hypothetical protein
MSLLTLRHEMDCDESTYWDKCVLDNEYNRRFFLEELKFKSYELIEQRDEGDTVIRKARAEPKSANMPGPIKKAIGDSFGYLEEGTFDRKTKRYSFRTIPAAFPDKVKIQGVMRCETLGPKRIARISEVQVDVKVFMIGGMIEDRIVADIKHSYAKAAEFTNTWVKEKGY